jgi:hypothetical protein
MRIASVIAALIAVKALFFALDDTVRIYLGDSAAYLYGARDDGRLPDDRSFTYSFVIRALASPYESVRLLAQWQTAAGVAVALLLYVLLARRFRVPHWLAFAAAFLLALEPAQLYYERMVLAEAIGLLAFASFFAACSMYCAAGRWWWLPIATFLGLAAASFRFNYLPVVLVMSLLVPVLRLLAPPADVAAGPGDAAEIPKRRTFGRDVSIAVASVVLMHGAYCFWVGQIFSAAPGYMGRAGFMQLGLVLPLVQSRHFADAGLADIERQLDYPIDDPHARMPHLWAHGGLIFEMRRRNLDIERLSRQLSRQALLDDPLGLVRIGLVTFGDYFRSDEIAHALHNDLGRREIPYDVLWNLREHWGYDARGLNTRNTVVSRYFAWGTWWLVACLCALPVLSVLNVAVHWRTPHRLHALLAALIGIGLFLAHLLFVPVALYRYLHPLPFFVILQAAAVCNACAVAPLMRRRELHRHRQAEAQSIADLQVERIDDAGGEFDGRIGAARGGDAPRLQVAHDLAYPACTVDEDHVDREPHERGVYGEAGRQHQGRFGRERVALQQAASPRCTSDSHFHVPSDDGARPCVGEHHPGGRFREKVDHRMSTFRRERDPASTGRCALLSWRISSSMKYAAHALSSISRVTVGSRPSKRHNAAT